MIGQLNQLAALHPQGVLTYRPGGSAVRPSAASATGRFWSQITP